MNQSLKNIYFACRPRQWTKNFFVFTAPIFAFQFDYATLRNTTFAFLCFCLASSSIYLLNDILDINSDKLHPKKKNRPIASGLVSIKLAFFTSIFLFLSSLLISFSISKVFSLVILIYFVIQFFYCIKLKQEPILDIFCISSGFLLRTLGGGLSSSLIISPWFLITVGFLALFLSIEKRKSELRLSLNTGIVYRKVLEKYTIPLLLRLESIASTSALMSYTFWASGPALNGAKTYWMLITVPFVLYGFLRYQLISDPNKNNEKLTLIESPELILIQDKGIKTICIIWLISTLLIGLISNN